MRKYSTHKPSGVEGIEDIPENWNLVKLKFIANNLNRRRIPLEEQVRRDMAVKEFDYYGATGIIDKVENFLFDETTILIAEDGANLISRNIQLIYIANGKYWVNNHAHILKPKTNCSLFFLALRLECFDYSNLIRGAAQPKLTKEDLMNINLPLPSIFEQHSIVHFLDYKTTQIDSFIANRQKQIELLKEQKAGIINKAVTKGINPTAKMKASGIEWIGDIPEHWFVGKVRRVLSVLTDFTANGSFADLAKNVNYLDTPDYSRLIRLTDLREDLRNDGIYVNKHAHEFLSKSELFGGEILMANVGAYAGFVCLVPEIDFIATLGPNMILLKFDKKKISNQYAFTLLSSNCYYKLLMNKALSSAQPKLNKEDVKSIDLIFPPTLEEQNKIIEYIKRETSTIDTLISKYHRQIDLMQEYRTSLISQAVTGKIDVRDWKQKNKRI